MQTVPLRKQGIMRGGSMPAGDADILIWPVNTFHADCSFKEAGNNAGGAACQRVMQIF
jgi:hypothetical protein